MVNKFIYLFFFFALTILYPQLVTFLSVEEGF